MRTKEDKAKKLPKSPGEEGRWVGRGAIEGWRKQLTERQLNLVYEYAGDVLARLDYPVRDGEGELRTAAISNLRRTSAIVDRTF
jgi:hypothetical protein